MSRDLLALEIRGDLFYPGFPMGEGDAESCDAAPPGNGMEWTLSALVVTTALRGIGVSHAVTLDMGPFTCGTDGLPDVSSLAEALERLSAQVDLTRCGQVVLVVPAALAAFRYLDLPFRSAGKIHQVLPMELSPLLPLADEPHYSDFTFTGTMHAGCHTLLTASVPCAVITAMAAVLEKRGLVPVFISAGGHVTARLFMGLDSQGKGTAEDRMMVAVQPCWVVVTGISEGGIVGIRAIERQGRDRTAEEIHRTWLGFCRRPGMDRELGSCHVIWSDAPDDGLVQSMEQTMGVAVTAVDASSLTAGVESAVLLSPHPAHAYLDAFAAVRCYLQKVGFDFSPMARKGTGIGGAWVRPAVVTAVLVFFCFCMAVAGEYVKINALEKEMARLDKQAVDLFRTTFPQVHTIVDPHGQMVVKVREAVREAEKNAGGAPGNSGPVAMTLLEELSGRIAPDLDVVVTRLIFTDDRVVLSGNTDTYKSVDRMHSAIESSALFTEVKIGSAAADKNDNRIRFKFTFQFTPQGDGP